MKLWATLIVLIYLALLALLSIPLLLLCFLGSSPSFYDVYTIPFTWCWFGVMAAGQALLLLVPIGAAERRPKARRKIIFPILASSLFLAALTVTAIVCILLAILSDKNNLFSGGEVFLVMSIVATLLIWTFWATLFFLFRRNADPDLLTMRLLRWLFAGSILELLIAVPSHIIVRQRGDCCAPVVTFFGITTGIAVMLMCLGPGVIFLYLKRIAHLRGEDQTPHCPTCGYDLRATPNRCPECGTIATQM